MILNSNSNILCDFHKKEWILDGETVVYGAATDLLAMLEYDLAQEKKFSYKELSTDSVIEHLAVLSHVYGKFTPLKKAILAQVRYFY